MAHVMKGFSSICVSCVIAAIVAVSAITIAVLLWAQFF